MAHLAEDSRPLLVEQHAASIHLTMFRYSGCYSSSI